tara:strand:+ start:858 stop:1079 length:222 start_codon:yes stop_codon:yes gene_type:complete
MHNVEVGYSLASLLSAFCVVFQWQHRFGVLLGFVMQIAWIHYWSLTGQQGIIILDGGILICCGVKYVSYWRGK